MQDLWPESFSVSIAYLTNKSAIVPKIWNFLLRHCFYASANVVAGSIMFPECLCVRVDVSICSSVCEFRTNIVSKISMVFVDGI